MFRKFEIVIECGKDEMESLQRFLMEAHRLSIVCFPSTISLDIVESSKNNEQRKEKTSDE